jgi:hypothetical protein
MSQHKMEDPLWKQLFMAGVDDYQITEEELSDLRNAIKVQLFHRLRPAKPSDVLGLSYHAMQIIEGHYERAVSRTTAEYDRIQEDLRTSGGTDAGEDSPDRGVPR